LASIGSIKGSMMKIFKITCIFFFSLLALSGCRKPFQPPPYPYENWKRQGASFEEQKLIMLECGYASPYMLFKDVSRNDIAKVHLCMERNAFKYTGELGTVCARHPNLPACVAAVEEKAASQGALRK
jgi:hypothetical protein